jgi:hypothetical protein
MMDGISFLALLAASIFLILYAFSAEFRAWESNKDPIWFFLAFGAVVASFVWVTS